MNRIYRVVKNKKTGLWVVASEVARSQGKPKSVASVAGAMGLLGAVGAGLGLLLGGQGALAAEPTAVPVNAAQTGSYVSANGSTVVDIQRANAAGLSHNQFSRFDANAKGLVLNNADGLNNVTVQSQLAGQIRANQNLSVPARLILNEVTSTQRSALAGFLEVAGTAADVVVANPNGITCNGCGFINTSRATLSTGTPQFSPAGELTGLRVSRGDIAVTGNGLNAKYTPILDLVSRTLTLEGAVNAQDLGVFLGPSDWRFDSRNGTALAADGAEGKPTYALDVAQLGGMYANTIRLIATEQGVGVRSLGEMAAMAGDFELTAAGQVALSGRLSATRDLQVASAEGLALTDASVSAQRDLLLRTEGTLHTTGGLLLANRDATLQAAALANQATDFRIQDNNVRHADGELRLQIAGAVDLSGGTWRANGDFRLAAEALSAEAEGTRLISGADMALQARSGAIALGQAQVVAQGALALQAATEISTAAAEQQIVQATSGALSLQADTLRQGGRLQAETQSQITLNTLVNSGSIVLSRQRSEALADVLSVQGDASNSAGGTVLSAGDLQLSVAGTLANAGTLQAATHTRLSTAALLNSGQLLLSTEAAADRTDRADLLQAGLLDNNASGVIASSSQARLSGSQLQNNGQVLVARAAELAYTDTRLGDGGLLQAGDALQLQGDSLVLQGTNARVQGALSGQGQVAVTLNGALGNAGQILSGTGMALRAASVGQQASGVLSAAQDLDIEAGRALQNQGQILARNLHLDATTLDNSGSIAASQTLRVDHAGAAAMSLANSGQVLGQSAALNVRATTLTAGSLLQAQQGLALQGDSLALTAADARLQGAVDGQGAVQLTLTGALDNAGQLLSGSTLDIAADSAGASAINRASGVVSAAQALTWQTPGGLQQDGQVLAQSVDLDTPMLLNSGSIAAREALSMAQAGGLASQFNNRGQVLAQDLSLRAQTNTLSAGSLLQAQRQLTLQGGTLALDRATLQGALSGSGQVAVSLSGALDNAGTLLSGGNLLLRAQDLHNRAAGDLSAASDLALTVANTLDNAGKIAGQNLQVSAKALDNAATGTVAARGQLTANASQRINDQGQILAGGAATLQTGALTVGGSGLLQSGGDLGITATSLNLNASGARVLGAQAGQGSTQISLGQALSNSATIQSGAALQISAPGISNTGSGRIGAQGTLLLDAGDQLSNQGQIQAEQLTVQAQQLNNAAGASINALGAFSHEGGQGLSNQGTLMAGSARIAVSGTVSLGADGLLQTMEGLTLSASQLSLAGERSQLMGALSGEGLVQLTLGQAFSNPGLLYAGQDLSLSAPAISNTRTGGIAADRDLVLTARAGDITNLGALYAGHSVAATASGGIYNHISYRIEDENTPTARQVLVDQGSIDSGGDITLSAATVVNSSSIDAAGNVSIRADQLYNQVQDGDSRTTTTGKQDYQSGSQYRDWYSFPNKYEETTYTNTWHNDQYFAKGAPAFKPQISGGGTVTLSGFSTGKNLGGVIQGNTVVVSSDVGGATFLNDDLSLLRTDYVESYRHYIKYIALGPAKYEDDPRRDYGVNESRTTLSSFGASIRANTLNASGFALTNAGSPHAPAVGSVSGSAGTAPDAIAVQAGSQPGQTTAQAGSAPGGVALQAGSSPASVSTSAVGAPAAVSLPVLDIKLPSNPNGYFVTNRDPAARYLVETNPKFNVGVSTVGSDFLATQLGLDTSTLEKRLGDASYEAYLVKQQLIAQTGSSLVGGYDNFAQAMQGMMESAASQASGLGLSYGQAPSAAQLAQLTGDMVWMVESIVDGQKVLAPVVYLAPATLASLQTGAVIAADSTTMALDALTNSGGTLAGKDSLTITAKGDISNLSGSIQGGDVSLSSTEGSIVNKTVSQTTGGAQYAATDIGKQAGITATGKLSLDAAKNIENIGAQMAAGGDASLNAGGDIVFDTVANKTTVTTSQVLGDGLTSGIETSRNTTTTHLQSGLTVGGNLAAKAGNDITLAGSNATVGGNASMDAGGNLNIVARENTSETDTQSKLSGAGVGGGLWGTTETTTTTFSSRNLGSTLSIGGNAELSAGKTMTVQGSQVDVGGDTSITATDVQVLAGKDVDRVTSTTTTTSFLKMEGGGSDASSQADSSSGTGTGRSSEGGTGDGQASGSAQAGANASASGSASASHQASVGLTLAETSVTQSAALSQRSVGSALNLGGNVSIKAANNVTLQGSEINAAGDVDLQAKSVALLAAQNIEQSSSATTTVSIGLYGSTDNNASAQGSAQAGASAEGSGSASHAGQRSSAGGSGKANASASAEGSAEASSKNTLDIMRVQQDTSESLNITNTGSAIRSGGSLAIKASENLKLVGSELAAEGDVNLQAKDMSFEAAQDISYSKATSSLTTVGLYLDANAKAEGSAKAEAGASAEGEAGRSGAALSASGSAEAKAEASVEGKASAGVSAGIQTKNVSSTQEQGSSTAMTSAIRSGSGSITRTAEGTIRDVGTAIEAAGDLNQSATTIESLAATNSQFERSSTETTVARVGVYAEASVEGKAGVSAGASAEGSAKIGGKSGDASASASAEASFSAEAKVGLEMLFNRDVSTESREATQAVVSNIKVGGNVNSASSGKTTLQGTNIESGGDINLSAQSLEVLAARDTEKVTSTSESTAARMAVSVGVSASGKVGASASTEDGVSAEAEMSAGVNVGLEASGSHERSDKTDASTTAVVSNLASGGKLNIKTTGATVMEGAQLSGAQGVDITAQSLDFKAAADTSSSSESTMKAGGEVSASISVVGNDHSLAAKGEFAKSDSQSSASNAVVGSINSGAGINIRTQGDTRLEGTQVSAEGDTSISAGGDVKIDAARNTAQSSSTSVNASAGFDTGEKTIEAGGGFEKSKASSSEAVTAGISSGGSLNISAGKSASFEGTNIAAGGDAQIAAGKDVSFNAARNESSSESSKAQVGLSLGKTEAEDEDAGTKTTTKTAKLDAEGGYERSRESMAVTGSVQAGNNLSVVAGNNVKFEGTELAAGNAASVAAGGNVDFVAAQSSSESVGVNASLSLEGSTERVKATPKPEADKTDGADDGKDAAGDKSAEKADKKVDEKSADKAAKADAADGKAEGDEKGEEGEEAAVDPNSRKTSGAASLGLGVSLDKQSSQQGARISAGAGGIQISSGGNVNLQGTQVQTDGQASVAAAGQVSQTAAVSQSISTSLGLELGAERSKQVGGEDEGTTSGRSGSLGDAQLSVSNSSDKTQIDAAGGSSVRSGVAPVASIPGVSLVLQATTAADGSRQTLVPLPGNLPPGTKVQATGADGKPLPSWVSFDAATGKLSGTPPADFSGALNVVIDVPQADGSSKKIGVAFVQP